MKNNLWWCAVLMVSALSASEVVTQLGVITADPTVLPSPTITVVGNTVYVDDSALRNAGIPPEAYRIEVVVSVPQPIGNRPLGELIHTPTSVAGGLTSVGCVTPGGVTQVWTQN